MKINIQEIDRISLVPETDSDFAVLKHMDSLGYASICMMKPLVSYEDKPSNMQDYSLTIKAYESTNL